MTMQPGTDAVARLRRYHTYLQPYDAQAVRAAFHPDATYLSPGIGRPLFGRDAIVAAFSTYFGRFADQISVDEKILPLGPHRAIAHWALTATDHQTGQVTTRHGTEEITFDAVGLILSVVVIDDLPS